MSLSRRAFTGLLMGSSVALSLGAIPAMAGAKVRKGQLSGRKGYTVKGTVELQKVNGKTSVVLASDYVFDPNKNPPDIKIGFGNGEKYAKGSKIHEALTTKKGAASFEVPASIDTDKYSELYIYCEQFSVILAVAPLK